ncbi:MAG TPA: alpha/beta fold hydrolase [Aliidongia sp.]|nr:alpha/beta fold hydrolase [Aliidongia sp.]
MIPRISEQAILLGKQLSLVGILTRAVTPAPTDGPVIVILNTGIIHRVGHHRMFVTMSRSLAQAGYTVLRFDFSGIGDSDPRADDLPPLESCLADLKEVLDWLEKEKLASKIILVGLCSGADHAVLYGHTDPRIAGLVLMDPSIPATARYYLHYLASRLMQLRNWISVLAGRSLIVKMWIEHLVHSVLPGQKSKEITLQNLRFHNYLEQCYQNSVARGIKMLAIFTADSTRQTYQTQMIDAFPSVSFGDQLALEFFSGSDHTFSHEADRSRLIQLVQGWIESINHRDLSRAIANPSPCPDLKFETSIPGESAR